MKITIEFDSLAEFELFRKGNAGPAPAAGVAAHEESELTPAQKAARTRAANKAKKEAEAKEREALERAGVETEPEPEPPAPEPEPTTEPATAESANASSSPAVAGDVDSIRARFKDLVGDDYETALGIVEQLGCGTFDEIVEAGKLGELVAAMDAVTA